MKNQQYNPQLQSKLYAVKGKQHSCRQNIHFGFALLSNTVVFVALINHQVNSFYKLWKFVPLVISLVKILLFLFNKSYKHLLLGRGEYRK